MNFYIDKYSKLLIACQDKKQVDSFYQRCSSDIASIILGRGFNEELDEYLSKDQTKAQFFHWWGIVRKSIFEN